MAFTKTPSIDTYQTKDVSLYGELDSRSGSDDTKDPLYVNVYFEEASKTDKTINIIKRAGLEEFGSALTGAVRGMYYWEDQDKYFVAISDDIYVYTASTGVAVTGMSSVFGTSTGDVGFTEFLYDNNSVKVVATDGTTVVTIDTANTVVPSADGDLPAHLPQPIFLDGYLFLVKSGTADIYNSDLNDPLAWTPGNFISCEMFPDTVVRIAKLNNYLVVFGSASVEYFWDAANASGSPLQRNDTPVKLYGYLGGYAQHGNKIYFVGNTSVGTPEILMLEDFKLKSVGNETVRRYLGSLTAVLSSTIGNVVSFNGHDFYVVNVSTRTYVLDLATEQWTTWAFQAYANFALEQAIALKSNTTYVSLVFINGESSLMKMSPSVYQDNDVDFTVTIVTPIHFFDTYNKKFMHMLYVFGDLPTASTSVDISTTDDDYQSYTTPRSIDLYQDLPSLHRLGEFRRRAFKLTYTDDFPLRLKKFSVEINIGNH